VAWLGEILRVPQDDKAFKFLFHVFIAQHVSAMVCLVESTYEKGKERRLMMDCGKDGQRRGRKGSDSQ
jgi:hypothetical protein